MSMQTTSEIPPAVRSIFTKIQGNDYWKSRLNQLFLIFKNDPYLIELVWILKDKNEQQIQQVIEEIIRANEDPNLPKLENYIAATNESYINEYRKANEFDMNTLRYPPKTQSFAQCTNKKCRSWNTRVTYKQVARGDEGIAMDIKCLDCGNEHVMKTN